MNLVDVPVLKSMTFGRAVSLRVGTGTGCREGQFQRFHHSHMEVQNEAPDSYSLRHTAPRQRCSRRQNLFFPTPHSYRRLTLGKLTFS